MKIDKKLIKELTGYLNEFNLTELEYADNDTKIKVSKARNINAPFNDNQNIQVKNDTTTNKKTSGNQVKSPIIGTAYLAPEPGGKPFVKVGDKVKKGQTIMIVEAMKTMNHIPSTSDGTVKKIMVNDGQPVEFGQTLIIIN